MIKTIQNIWHSKTLRNQILFTLGVIVVYRFMTHITIPGVDRVALQAVFDKNALLGAFSLLTGGSAENFSIVLMGLSPYINASIIVQLLTVIVPRMEEISKEGETGRKRMNKWTRWLALPIAFFQSYGMIALLNAQSQAPIIANFQDWSVLLPIMATVTAGTLALMWLGEMIGEKGIGNGISMIIFAGILASVPTAVGPSLALAAQDTTRLLVLVAMVLITILLTLVVVLFTEGQRRIPVTYAGRTAETNKGEHSFLPIRVNQAGMIPIIFAMSIVSFPGIIGQFMALSSNELVRKVGTFFMTSLQATNYSYMAIYFLLVIAFTYFYVSITFNTENVADNLQKRGGFIPGTRPGKDTADYLSKVSNRMNLFGGVMIGAIAILPLVIQKVFTEMSVASVPMIVGGAGIIIVVGVVIDVIRKINTQLLSQKYDRFYKG